MVFIHGKPCPLDRFFSNDARSRNLLDHQGILAIGSVDGLVRRLIAEETATEYVELLQLHEKIGMPLDSQLGITCLKME